MRVGITHIHPTLLQSAVWLDDIRTLGSDVKLPSVSKNVLAAALHDALTSGQSRGGRKAIYTATFW
jgi:hypothetical protein